MQHPEEKNNDVSFWILGEPASKANSRRMVVIGKKPRLIKSQKALDYCKTFAKQCPQLDDLIEDDIVVHLHIFYASRRPDLDESVILDEMQGKIYKNDRQVKVKHVYWHLDRDNPRSHVRIEIMASGDIPSID
jgi:hypothetical protein